ncbi:MAG: electron transport complex subunit RsxC [Thioploca sp.]|nr:electron transport complex subunit RsxC [Thioploca sp.]
MTRFWQFHGGIKLNGNKNLSSEQPIAKANLPQFLILPLLQHIGVPAEPVVKVGDKVLKGQIIAHCQANDCHLKMSVPLHASSSGTVVAIEPHSVPHPSGLKANCIVIETDGRDEWVECNSITDYTTISPMTLRQHIAMAGIVGLGGAGFPAHMKLKSAGIDTLIINGAECEPYITCDDRLMREYPDDIVTGAQIFRHILGGTQHCIIAVEDNKPAAYSALLQSAQGRVSVVKVPTLYPTGGEKQLIHVLTGQEIGKAQLPADFGIVVHNIETTRAVYRAVKAGRPLISRVVTVTGNGIEQPQNLEVLLGTPIQVIIDQCGRKPDIEQLIMGGPMMGFTLPHDQLPIIKTTNCLIISSTPTLATQQTAMPCIRCGACAQVCPVNLLPQQLYWYTKAKDFKMAKNYHLFDCIECGCCAYVCPSYLPLVDYYRYAKAEIRANEQERQKANLARNRHEFRTFRLAREKAEKLARHQSAAAASQPDKKIIIEAALERVKAKKTHPDSEEKPILEESLL